jgi:hypothetical protein
MFNSRPVVAFDQHAGSVTAAVLFSGARRPAAHQLAAHLPTIRRFVQRACSARARSVAATKPAPAASNYNTPYAPAGSRAT